MIPVALKRPIEERRVVPITRGVTPRAALISISKAFFTLPVSRLISPPGTHGTVSGARKESLHPLPPPKHRQFLLLNSDRSDNWKKV